VDIIPSSKVHSCEVILFSLHGLRAGLFSFKQFIRENSVSRGQYSTVGLKSGYGYDMIPRIRINYIFFHACVLCSKFFGWLGVFWCCAVEVSWRDICLCEEGERIGLVVQVDVPGRSRVKGRKFGVHLLQQGRRTNKSRTRGSNTCVKRLTTTTTEYGTKTKLSSRK
jgi:hypothetical protein